MGLYYVDKLQKTDSFNVPKSARGKIPWTEKRLSDDMMKHLWDSINYSDKNKADKVVGDISTNKYLLDKDNLFYNNVLKECTENMYYEDWKNYYEVFVVKTRLQPIFGLTSHWVNFQKQHEFVSPHTHQNGTGYSFVIFMKIPTHWEEQHGLVHATESLPHSHSFSHSVESSAHTTDDNATENLRETNLHDKYHTRQSGDGIRNYQLPSCASDFKFTIPNTTYREGHISLSPEDEGRMLFFPSWLVHQVFPFHGTEEDRITISGNVAVSSYTKRTLKIGKNMEKQILEIQYLSVENQIEFYKERLKELTLEKNNNKENN